MVVLGLYAFTPMTVYANPPPPPSDLMATGTQEGIVLNWKNYADPSNTQVWIVRSTNGVAYNNLEILDGNIGTYTDTACNLGITYYYRVLTKSIANGSFSAESNTASAARLGAPPAITSNPANKSVYVGNTATFTVAATGTLGLKYQWQWRIPTVTIWNNVVNSSVTTGATSPTLSITPVDTSLSGTNYRCIVTNDYGSATSSEVKFEVMLSPVAAPSNLTAAAEAGGIVLKWNDNSNNETGFIIERKDGGSGWGQLDYVAANVTTYKDTNVQDGKTYSYKVNATAPSTASGYSNEVTATMASMFAVTVNSGTGGGNYSAGQNVAIKANTPPAGKVFDKWTTSSSGVTFTSAANANTAFTMPSNAVTVTATYKDKDATMYKVTMKYNNGEPDWIQSVKEGDKADPGMEDPIKAGYKFAGWYKDAQFKDKYNFNVPVTANITLYAKWTGAGESATEPDDGVDTADDEATQDDETDAIGDDNERTPGSATLFGSNGGIDRMLILFIVLVAVAAVAVTTFLIIRKKDKG